VERKCCGDLGKVCLYCGGLEGDVGVIVSCLNRNECLELGSWIGGGVVGGVYGCIFVGGVCFVEGVKLGI
ncbi:hypothetical protein, partial [Staphylococcus pasteuri]|uniref:hypothetical protein n=1 Tax=Staphylococcus pasteuri TaxID=45972 RepID=UPI001C99B00A